MRKNIYVNNLLRDREFSKQILIYFSSITAGDDYDSYEANATYTLQNPIAIKGYVSQLSASSLIYRGYGLKETGSLQVICEKKYRNYFENARKITIEGDEYSLFKEATGNRALITDRPFETISVILQRV